MNTNMKIVISGSFRKHLHEIGMAMANFKKTNIKILAPLTKDARHANDGFIFLATDNPKKSADTLEKEFIAQIEKADFLYLANVDGYIGQSSATEMGVAVISGVPIVIAEAVRIFSDEIPETAQKLLRQSIFCKLSIDEINAENITKLPFANFKPFNLSSEETILLQSLVEKLLNNLKIIKIAI